ncbi:hypothetical protein ACE6H2_006009 [Prunus campanulata]
MCDKLYRKASADIRNTIPESEFHSPTRPEPTNPTLHEEASRFTLSHYSSSRGSSHSFLHQKKISYDARSNVTGTENGENRLIIVDGGGKGDDGGDEDDDEEYYGVRKTAGWWKTYCSYRNSDSCVWICMQISWRAMLSLCVALLVFYIATKPPPPKVSIKGPKLYAAESGSSKFKLYVGTRNKPMYGAGRSMQDMLESGKGLPLVLRVSLHSSFHVVWSLIKPKFHHQAECLLVLHRAYDKKHRTQAYDSTCVMT